ncbi:hypothetical protein RBB77_10170 [Tunturibacter psychrotolerans]|uniref:Transposase n=1 Tax=Tunturiibacter psychrotolerans TaxID=3069686 RepID=A0AAU7ZWF8_9BACT
MALANAQHIKAIPDRKTDMMDYQRIVELLRHGLVRGSYVLSPVIRDLRDLTEHVEPLLHAQRRWTSSGPGPISYQSLGSREEVYRSASSTDRDGSGNPFDMDQRTA